MAREGDGERTDEPARERLDSALFFASGRPSVNDRVCAAYVAKREVGFRRCSRMFWTPTLARRVARPRMRTCGNLTMGVRRREGGGRRR